MSKYLKLSAGQHEEVANICEYFSTQMGRATTAKKDQEKKLHNAVYGNLKLMKKTLTDKQYADYAKVLNVTLQNKGIEVNIREGTEHHVLCPLSFINTIQVSTP